MVRRPRSGKHLERDAAVAEQVAAVVDSRGPCPGTCNRAYRRRVREWDADVRAGTERVLEETRAALVEQLVDDDLVAAALGRVDADDVLESARARAAASWEVRGRSLLDPREGRPVWCHRCTSGIRAALDGLPRMVLLTLEASVVPAHRPPAGEGFGSDGALVAEPVLVVDVGPGGGPGLVTEVLACGHRHTRGQGPHAPGLRRVCLTCVAAAIVPEHGRLALGSGGGRSARHGGRRRSASPAGSPAWLEVDAAMRWVCEVADEVAFVLDGPKLGPGGRHVRRWPREHGTVKARVESASGAARYLARRLEDVLAMPDPIPHRVGQGALSTFDRLESVAGMKLLVHSIKDPCPRCARRGLYRMDGGSMVQCKACHAWWDESYFAHWARTTAAGGAIA